MECYCVVLLTLWPHRPLTFECQNSTTSRVSQDHSLHQCLKHFGIIRFWDMLRTNRLDSKILPTPTDTVCVGKNKPCAVLLMAIPPEVFKHGVISSGFVLLHGLFEIIWRNDSVPQDLKDSSIHSAPIQAKGRSSELWQSLWYLSIVHCWQNLGSRIAPSSTSPSVEVKVSVVYVLVDAQ